MHHCFVCASVTPVCLDTHLSETHGWENTEGLSGNIKLSFVYWRAMYSTQCLEILNSCVSIEDYPAQIAQIEPFLSFALTFPPGYPKEAPTKQSNKAELKLWNEHYRDVEIRLINALEQRSFFGGTSIFNYLTRLLYYSFQ